MGFILQFLEYCNSQTRNVINNIESLEQFKNLLHEYRKWRPLIFLHYKLNQAPQKPKANVQETQINLQQQQVNNISLATVTSSAWSAQFDLVSRGSLNQSLDLPAVMAAIDDGRRILGNSVVGTGSDILEEFKYKQWQDLSPDALTCFQFLEDTQAAKFMKLNIYKLYDFSTIAQYELQNMKKAFAQIVYTQNQLNSEGAPARARPDQSDILHTVAGDQLLNGGIDQKQLHNDIKVRMYLEGNTNNVIKFKQEALISIDPTGRPTWITSSIYFLMTLMSLGWIMRLYLYRNTICVNYYLKKVILK